MPLTASTALASNDFLLCFPKHNGEKTITSLFFMNIMERLISDIFSLFVFNNIMEVTCIFPPRVFSLLGAGE